MKRIETGLQDSYLIEVPRFEDERGFFIESFNLYNKWHLPVLVQDNHSRSIGGVIRGLHYQIEHPQGKLVRCSNGIVYDVIVDLRMRSSTFGKSFGVMLDRPELQLWVPPGFAHGFYTVSGTADFQYKTSDTYYPEYERTLLWNDPVLEINWPLDSDLTRVPVVSDKDRDGLLFKDCEKYK